MTEGIREAGHEVETISLKGKSLKFCTGCLVCQKTQKCILNDDAIWIAEKVKMADTLVFSTPIYYYGLSGQTVSFRLSVPECLSVDRRGRR